MTTEPPAPLLEYGLATAPTPLRSSAPGSSTPGTIEIAVGPAPTPAPPVYCSTIEIGIPIGEGEGNFSKLKPTITPSSAWWTPGKARLESGGALGVDSALILFVQPFSTTQEHWEIDYPFAFQVETAAVSPNPGEFQPAVGEWSTGDPGTKPLFRRQGFALTKAPAQLYVDNFFAVAAGSNETTQPRGEFGPGKPIKLIWESNAESFEVWAGAEGKALWKGGDNTYTVEEGRTGDTTFTLVAKLGAEERRATYTVTVPPPTLAASSVATATAKAGQGRAKQGMRIGDWKPASAESDVLVVKGTLQALTGVSPQERITLGQKNVVKTDALIVGSIWIPTSEGARALMTAKAEPSGFEVAASGGLATLWIVSKKETQMGSFMNSLLLPLRAGESVSLGVTTFRNSTTAFAFWIFPFGSGPKGGPAIEVLEEFTEPGAEPAPLPKLPWTPKAERIAALVGAADQLLGHRVGPDARERFAATLERQIIDTTDQHQTEA